MPMGNKKKRLGLVVSGVLSATMLLSGCQTTPQKPGDFEPGQTPKASPSVAAATRKEIKQDIKGVGVNPPDQDAMGTIAKASKKFSSSWDQIRQGLQKKVPPPPAPAPVLPKYNPLDDIMVSLQMHDANVQDVLRALAKQTKMNLLISPNVVNSPTRLSVSFHHVPASTVFKDILSMADLNGRINGNVLRVQKYEQAMYQLDFLESNTSANFSAGGDVLGAASISGSGSGGSGSSSGGSGGSGGSGSGSSNGLTGTFSVTGTSSKTTNPYDALSQVLDGLFGTSGSAKQGAATGSSASASAARHALRQSASLDGEDGQ